MATRAKGTGRAKGPRGPAQARAASKAPAQPEPPAAPATAGPTAAGPTAAGSAAGSAAAGSERQRPAGLRLAAAAQGVEAAGLCVATVFAAISTADGRSQQLASGIAVTLIALCAAAGLAAIAVGLARARPWSRVPAVMSQLFVVIAGVSLLDGQRPEWGVPALVLAAACVAGLLTPASLRALNRPSAKSR
jgi:hypothetical protein